MTQPPPFLRWARACAVHPRFRPLGLGLPKTLLSLHWEESTWGDFRRTRSDSCLRIIEPRPPDTLSNLPNLSPARSSDPYCWQVYITVSPRCHVQNSTKLDNTLNRPWIGAD